MANWKALTWSESVKTGKQTARHVLTVLCLKCDDDYRVFSDATRLAGFCELSPRRLYDWRDYLEEHGFITVIRRVRPNGSEAKPITLLNAPDAPHLNGVPVVLDYSGKYLYPRYPHELHTAGIQWVSSNEQGRVHPSHTPIQPDSSSGCQHDNLAACATCTESASSQAAQHDDSSGRQPDNSSPHGGDNSSPPRHSPCETSPTNQAAADESASSGDDWLVGEEDRREKPDAAASEPDAAGTMLLRSLPMPDGASPLADHAVREWASLVDACLTDGHSPVRLIERLTNGLGDTRKPAGAVVSRLKELQAERNRPTSKNAATTGAPSWCGQCGSHYPDRRAEKNPKWRMVLDPVTDAERRCTCHPKHPDQLAANAA